MADQDQGTSGKQIAIQKIYVKDFSFESPHTPDVFAKANWSPKTNLNLRSSHTTGTDNNHEVVLTITIEAKEDEQTFFLVELQQAGLFHIAGYDEAEFKAIIGSYCPNILFPYAWLLQKRTGHPRPISIFAAAIRRGRTTITKSF